MDLTIMLGWWIAPALVTLLAFIIAGNNLPVYSRGYGDGIAGVFILGVAIIVSLIAWLVWAVLT